MRKLIRRLVLWTMPELAPRPSTIFVIGDPFDVETNPRLRLERARRVVTEHN